MVSETVAREVTPLSDPHPREWTVKTVKRFRTMRPCMACKTLGVDPQAYLRDVLDRISTHSMRRVEELLPDRWKAPPV
jgi:hypothetical protein